MERTTRFTVLLHLPTDHGATAVHDAITTTITTLPAVLRRSLSWDQGIERSEHLRLTIAADLPVHDPEDLARVAAALISRPTRHSTGKASAALLSSPA